MPLLQYNLLTRHHFCTNLPSDRPRPVSFFATAVALRRCRYRPHRHWCTAVAASAIPFFSIVPLVVFSASRYAALLSFCAAAPIPCISDSICSVTVLLFVSAVRKNRLDCASLAFVHLYHHRIGHLQPIHLSIRCLSPTIQYFQEPCRPSHPTRGRPQGMSLVLR